MCTWFTSPLGPDTDDVAREQNACRQPAVFRLYYRALSDFISSSLWRSNKPLLDALLSADCSTGWWWWWMMVVVVKETSTFPTSPLRRQAMTREEAETMQRKSPATADPPKHASFIKRSLTIHVKTVVLGKLGSALPLFAERVDKVRPSPRAHVALVNICPQWNTQPRHLATGGLPLAAAAHALTTSWKLLQHHRQQQQHPRLQQCDTFVLTRT